MRVERCVVRWVRECRRFEIWRARRGAEESVSASGRREQAGEGRYFLVLKFGGESVLL